MSVIKSSINTRSEDFQANAASLRAQVEDLRAKAAQVSLGGGESAFRFAALQVVSLVTWVPTNGRIAPPANLQRG